MCPSRILLTLSIAIALFAVALAALSHGARATDVTGDITASTSWDKANSPYMLKNNIIVKGGAILQILPGVEVMFAGTYTLTCEGSGRIDASGLATDRIVFTSGRGSPALGDWSNLASGIGGVFKNCSFSYGTYGLTLQDNAKVIDGNFTWDTTSVHIAGTNVLVMNCEINGATGSSNPSVGIYFDSAFTSRVVGCKVTDCQEGINLLGTTAMCSIEDTFILQALNHGIAINSTGQGHRIYNCTVEVTKKGLRLMTNIPGGIEVNRSSFSQCNVIGIEIEKLHATTPVVIQRCMVKDSNKGVYIKDSDDILMTECTIKENNMGVQVEGCKGYLDTIWRNNIMSSQGAQLAVSLNSNVSWDKDGKGNYWDPFNNRIDNNGDGISDNPYMLTGTQKDNRPLMKPVDYDSPVAKAGPSLKVKQHRTFVLDGSASDDNTWIANYTWTIPLPSGDKYLYGKKPTGVVDVTGVYIVTLVVTDPVGLTGMATTVLNVTDADPPVFVNVTTPTVAYDGSAFNFSARITDNVIVTGAWASYRFGLGSTKRVDLVYQGDDVWAADINLSVDLMENIYYTLSARDRENNIGRTTESLVRVVDAIPPKIEPQLPTTVNTGDDAWINSTATDNRGVAYIAVEYWFPLGEHASSNMSGMGVSWSFLLHVPLNASSPLTVVFNATDVSGNSALSPELTVPVRDNKRPVVNLDLTDTRLHYGAPATFKVMMSDNLGITEAFVDIRYSSTEYEPTPLTKSGTMYTATVPVAIDKGHLLWYRYRALDAAGNELVTPEVQVTLLSQNPKITTEPSGDAYEGREFSLHMEATDPDNMDYELLWSMTSNATWLIVDPSTGIIAGTPATKDIGIFWVNVTVSDPEGGTDWKRFNVLVHEVNNPPVVSITSPEDGQKVGTILRVSGTSTDDDGIVLWVRYRIDQGEWQNVSSPSLSVWGLEVQTTGIVPGRHYVDVKAFDGANESDIKSISFLMPEKAKPKKSPGLEAPTALVALAALALAVSRARRR